MADRLSVTAVRSVAMRFAWIALNALTGVISARALLPEGRGQLAAMILWPMLLAAVTSVGLPSALVYHVRRDARRAAEFVGWALVLCVVTTALGVLGAWYVVPLWLHRQPAHVIAAAQWFLLMAPLCSLTVVGRAAWEASGRFERSNLSQLGPPLGVILGLSVLWALGALTPVSAAAVYMLAGVPAIAWIVWSVSRQYRPTLRGARGAWRDLLHYGGRSYGIELAGVLSLHVDQALAVGLLSPAAMGIYAVALNLSRIVPTANSVAASMAFPKVVGLEPSRMAEAIARWARMGSLASAATGAAILIAGPFLLRVLYGPAFAVAGQILPLLVGQALIAGLVHMLLQGFLAAGRPGLATVVQLTGFGVSVPLFLILTPRFGLTGVAVALLVSTGVRLAVTLVCYRVVLRVPTPRLWIGGADLAEAARYRSVVVASMLRLRAAGGMR